MVKAHVRPCFLALREKKKLKIYCSVLSHSAVRDYRFPGWIWNSLEGNIVYVCVYSIHYAESCKGQLSRIIHLVLEFKNLFIIMNNIETQR